MIGHIVIIKYGGGQICGVINYHIVAQVMRHNRDVKKQITVMFDPDGPCEVMVSIPNFRTNIGHNCSSRPLDVW